MQHQAYFTLLAIILLTIVTQPLCTASYNKLNQLNHKIDNIKAFLSLERTKRSKYQSELRKTEIASGNLLVTLKKTHKNLKKQQASLQALARQTTVYQSQLINQRARLTQQIRAAYVLGRQPYLKLIINQSDAERMSRMLTYYRYISSDQTLAIHQLQATLAQLQNNQRQIQEQTQVLKQLDNKQQQERNKLERVRHNRKILIHRLNNQIHTKNHRLATLLANKRLLEQTISHLGQNTSISAAMQQNFNKLRGKLPWPTKGKILTYFGTKIFQSEIRWGGVLIKAPEDQPVRAIAAGKVVFAKWLPGYGLLLIISHGHGYMTLYGRNHYLYKKPGDIVQRGTLIATVGNSGGYEQSALYFAIRHNAKPLNPVNWCSAEHL